MAYIAIDIGGTKTLVCSLSDEGVIEESIKFPTDDDYPTFLEGLRSHIASLKTNDFRAGAIAAPGRINRKKNIIERCGNLDWENVDILRDVEPLAGCPLRLENDAKLGALSEAMLLKDAYGKVLYVTISTGIGMGLIENGVINTTIGDGGGRAMILAYQDKLMPWESFASGSAIVRKYGKLAAEINDKKTWSEIVRTFTPGFLELIAVLNPEVIVVGGGAGHYLEKFHDLLVADLGQYETPMLKIPPILPAQRPDEAVIYGCYDYARQKYV